MTEKELQTERRVFNIYSGILFNYPDFQPGLDADITYDFDCPEYQTLREKYGLDKLAGKGGAFERARRLLHHFAPRLTHSPYYDNHVRCDALSLLEYSYERPDQGINCLNKAKILAECCLAEGIYARRTGMMPLSPYDNDNHIVTEIYDPAMSKWIMLDPTTDGYIVDGQGDPLSVLEVREKFARQEFATLVTCAERKNDLKKLRDKHAALNTYYCKNLFWLSVDPCNGFGPREKALKFLPVGYDMKRSWIRSLEHRLEALPEWGLSPEETKTAEESCKKLLEEACTSLETRWQCYDIGLMLAAPK